MRPQGKTRKHLLILTIVFGCIGGVTSSSADEIWQSAVIRQDGDAPPLQAHAGDSTLLRQAEELYVAGTRAEQQDRSEEAEKIYRQCAQFDKNHDLKRFRVPALHRLAVIKAKSGNLSESEAFFKEALPDCEQNIPFLCDFAKLYADQRRYEEAEPIMKNIVLLVPEDRRALFNLGFVIASQRDRQTEGLRYFKLAFSEPEAYREIAKIYRLQGNVGQAEFAEQRARAIEMAGTSNRPGIESLTPEGRQELQNQLKKELFVRESVRLVAEMQKSIPTDPVMKTKPLPDAAAFPSGASYAELCNRQFTETLPLPTVDSTSSESSSAESHTWIMPSPVSLADQTKSATQTPPQQTPMDVSPNTPLKALPETQFAETETIPFPFAPDDKAAAKVNTAYKALPATEDRILSENERPIGRLAAESLPIETTQSLSPLDESVSKTDFPKFSAIGNPRPLIDSNTSNSIAVNPWKQPAVVSEGSSDALNGSWDGPAVALSQVIVAELPRTSAIPIMEQEKPEYFPSIGNESLEIAATMPPDKQAVRLIDSGVSRPTPERTTSRISDTDIGDAFVQLRAPKEPRQSHYNSQTGKAVESRHPSESSFDPEFKLEFVHKRKDNTTVSPELQDSAEARLAFRPIPSETKIAAASRPENVVPGAFAPLERYPDSDLLPQRDVVGRTEWFEASAPVPQPMVPYRESAKPQYADRNDSRHYSLRNPDRVIGPETAMRQSATVVTSARQPEPVFQYEPVHSNPEMRFEPHPESVLIAGAGKQSRMAPAPEAIVNPKSPSKSEQAQVLNLKPEPSSNIARPASRPQSDIVSSPVPTRTPESGAASKTKIAVAVPPEPKHVARNPEPIEKARTEQTPISDTEVKPEQQAIAWTQPTIVLPISQAKKREQQHTPDFSIEIVPISENDRSSIAWKEPHVDPRREPSLGILPPDSLTISDSLPVRQSMIPDVPKQSKLPIKSEIVHNLPKDRPIAMIDEQTVPARSPRSPKPAPIPEPGFVRNDLPKQAFSPPAQPVPDRYPQAPIASRPAPMPTPAPEIVRDDSSKEPFVVQSEQDRGIARSSKPAPTPMPEPIIAQREPSVLLSPAVPEQTRQVSEPENIRSTPKLASRPTAVASMFPETEPTKPESASIRPSNDFMSPRSDITARVDDLRREEISPQKTSAVPVHVQPEKPKDDSAGFATSRRGEISANDWIRHQQRIEQARKQETTGSVQAESGEDVGFARSSQYAK